MHWKNLLSDGRPGSDPDDRLVIYLAVDDDYAKQTVSLLINELGFAPLDTGGLPDGGPQQQP